MSLRTPTIPWIAAATALLAAVAWQVVDLRDRTARELHRHEHHALALLSATEAIVVRECRGGRAQADELRAALDRARAAFELRAVALRRPDGTLLAESGDAPSAPDPRLAFAKTFEPLRPQSRSGGAFGGPPWSGGATRPADARTIELPDALELSLVLHSAPLDEALADLRGRAALTTAALAVAVLLVAGSFWLRGRSIALRSDLAASRAQLEGLSTLGRLGAGLAHETRNPLGVVRGFAERLADGRIPAAEIPAAARAIVDETDRTLARLDEFLLLSRPAELRRAPVEVSALFDELSLLLRPDLDDRRAHLELRCRAGRLDADRDQLRRLLMNLLLNAIQAARPGGRVTLGCESAPAGRHRIVVEDDGPGVPPELRASLFEPYVTGRPGGTGLGLAICRRIALDHGFGLRYEPVAPHGTRMVLEVPAP
ncbi:MAG: hypothetical protein IPM29_30995 [Planctomycetes bacterium]|nr:hypothetical protein [Planctomycetota bacterium]